MKSTAKKVGFLICVVAAGMVISSTVSGWLPEKTETEEQPTASITQTLE